MKSLLLVLILLAACLYPSSTLAQFEREDKVSERSKTFTDDELNDIDSLEDETRLRRRDVTTGLFLDSYSTYDDRNRSSFLFHVNNDLSAIMDLQTLEFNYAHRFEIAWLELFILRSSGKFREFSGSGAEAFNQQETEDSVLAFGAGISYRGTWVQDLVNSDKMFTTTGANLGWYSLTENFAAETYSGPGLKTDFGLHRRASPSLHYGVKMSYHLAHVERAEEFEGETSAQRSIVLSWLSFGFDLSFYF